jgi:hypothetical protein
MAKFTSVVAAQSNRPRRRSNDEAASVGGLFHRRAPAPRRAPFDKDLPPSASKFSGKVTTMSPSASANEADERYLRSFSHAACLLNLSTLIVYPSAPRGFEGPR